VDEVAKKARLDADFTELYRAHLRDVYSYSYYRVGNHHDAEDVTEQTFLQAYRHFERAQRVARRRSWRTPARSGSRTAPRTWPRGARSSRRCWKGCPTCPTTAARR
jgi:DNA-directed RNA polymerase specialized sigma24 family protein